MKRLSRVYFLLALGPALALFAPAIVSAANDALVQSFKADSTVQPDWVVSLKANAADTVELTPANQSGSIYGVAIDPSKAPLTLQKSTNQRVFVASNGNYPVLVSTQNGAVKPGDYLSISSTSGIAAKATSSETVILGRALEKFDGTSGTLTKGNNGEAVGIVNVDIAPGKNPLLKSDIAIPAGLKKFGNTLAGKDVSSIRIYASLAVFLIAAGVAFNITLVGIRSAMNAIGRNPLSKHSIMRSLSEVIIMAVTVLFLGMFSVYLLLRL